MNYSVFLSHSGKDSEWAAWVKREAALVGLTVYLFEHDLQPGTYVAAKVQQAIRMCDAMVVLLTRNSEASPYVQQEIGFAQAAQKPVVPLVWPDVQTKNLAMLEGREYVRFDPARANIALPPVLEYLKKLKAKQELAISILALAGLVVAAFGVSGK